MSFKQEFEDLYVQMASSLGEVEGLHVITGQNNLGTPNSSFYVEMTKDRVMGRATAYEAGDMFDVQVIDRDTETMLLNRHSTDNEISLDSLYMFLGYFKVPEQSKSPSLDT